MANEVAVITGGGSGIGQALAQRLAEEGFHVLIAGRRAQSLEETKALMPASIQPVVADVATPEGRECVREAVGTSRLRFLIHNAGVLEPVGPLERAELDAWRRNMAVNVEAPLFLTQALLPRLRGGGRVLHISSGAAHHPYPGWGAYCTGKAALHMLYQVWGEELEAQDIAVGSLRPGVVDTPMQALIREQTPENFPRVERFLKLKEQGLLRSPAEVADFCRWLLLEPDPQRFAAHEWDIGNPEHTADWQD